MAKINPIRRLAIIVAKLSQSGDNYISAQDLIDHVNRKMQWHCAGTTNCTQRTLQRDFKTIEELFGITICYSKSRGYHIAERNDIPSFYANLLLNFEMLNAIDRDSVVQRYVLADHRRPATQANIADMLDAIRNRYKVEFDYTLFRKGNAVVSKQIEPHYLKESQQRWYLVGYDTDNKLKTFAIDRISLFRINADERFTRRTDIDVPALFRESFGIWNDPQMPIDEIILRYDAVDGAFIKTFPLHTSQEIIEETADNITIRLHLRITNDFVMELLSRSSSVEVLNPLSLRRQLYDIYVNAIQRNKPHDD
ncbi:MAG: WYL domain-containing protein [Porphyromonadaceae bacterium]|nr:WYL domain-containing protein [Porphyromonadaceae bacterium]